MVAWTNPIVLLKTMRKYFLQRTAGKQPEAREVLLFSLLVLCPRLLTRAPTKTLGVRTVPSNFGLSNTQAT